MALLPILKYPHKNLHRVASPVEEFDAELVTLTRDMLETMYAKNGVGLAATQVDVHRRVVVIDVSETRDKPMILINPEIISAEGEREGEEGCLSIPEIFDKVVRHAVITARAQNEKGKSFEFEAEGLLSVCVQHEIDHLNGILFTQHLSQLKQQRIRSRVLKWQKKSPAA